MNLFEIDAADVRRTAHNLLDARHANDPRIAPALTVLTEWAKTGQGSAGLIEAELRLAITLLYIPPMSLSADYMRWRIALVHKPTDLAALSQVVLAARGRVRLRRRDQIATNELAALTSYTDHHIRHLVRQGKLALVRGEGTRAPIAGKSARGLLAAREVPQ